jgi:murein DD-endopeptidase MepM/ murein hydrolase activator NlpD
MRKRYYLLFVARDEHGELRKIHIPLHYVYVFLIGALAGMFTITGMAGSYTRMLMKVAHYNELRAEKEALKQRYAELQQVAREKDMQTASLSSLASEVSELYGLKSQPVFPQQPADNSHFADPQFTASLDQFTSLKNTAMSGTLAMRATPLTGRGISAADWLHAIYAPYGWPIEGRVTGSFGDRIDPFNGEGAFHAGIDIAASYGHPVFAPADGVVVYADMMAGYGRLVVIQHGHDISTRYGHLSGFHVTVGQTVRKGDVIGYVGLSGRSTGPHLHYEVRIHDIPVNPHKYLRRAVTHGNLASIASD